MRFPPINVPFGPGGSPSRIAEVAVLILELSVVWWLLDDPAQFSRLFRREAPSQFQEMRSVTWLSIQKAV
jgi:hypothetical protein